MKKGGPKTGRPAKGKKKVKEAKDLRGDRPMNN